MSESFVPFVLGEAGCLAALPDQMEGRELVKIPIGASSVSLSHSLLRQGPSTAPSKLCPPRFARLLNLANGVAYGGGMGMPEWVMLDCALLPSFFAGFMGLSGQLSPDARSMIKRGLTEMETERSAQRIQIEEHIGVTEGELSDEEWFPLAEFCAIPRLYPAEVVGYSLYSLKRGLGVRAKALGLWLLGELGYRRQVGVAQWSNLAAVKSHLRFGALELIDPMTPSHTKAGETFIYRLTLPSQRVLAQMALGERSAAGQIEPNPEAQWRSTEDLRWWLERREACEGSLYVSEIRGERDQREALVEQRLTDLKA